MSNQQESLLSGLEQKYNFRPIIYLILKYWYVYLIGFAVCFTTAFLINKYTTPVHKVVATVMVRNDQKNISRATNPLMDDKTLPFLKYSTNINDEIQTLTSRDMIKNVLDRLDFNLNIFEIGRVKTMELYNNSPIRIEYNLKDSGFYGVPVYISIDPKNIITLTFPEKNNSTRTQTKKCKFGEVVNIPGADFVFTPKPGLNSKYFSEHPDYKFYINNKKNQVDYFLGALSIKNIKETSVLEITLNSTNPDKAEDFLAELCELYIEKEITDKNEISEKTLKFIDDQLEDISNTLISAENDIENFKAEKGVIEIGAEAASYFEQIQLTEAERLKIEMKLNALKILEDYVAKKYDISGIAPSLSGLEDPLLAKLIEQLKDLQQRKINQKYDLTESHPNMVLLNQQIEETRKSLLENINNYRRNIISNIQTLGGQIARFENILKDAPKAEREFLAIKRKFSLSESLYLYLLEKKAEMGISRQGNVAENKILDSPIKKGRIKPNTSQNNFVALILSLAIPSLIIYLLNLLDDKVRNRFQIEKSAIVPMLGIISHNFKKSNLVVKENPKSHIAESFRAIRTNLQYLAPEVEKKVILITSTVGGEGKSFFSMNLSTIFAMGGKKVLLMGFDLRKPKLYGDFRLKNDLGVTNYLINKASLNEIIHETFVENLYFAPSGPIPPNPAELIGSEKIPQMFEELKRDFDLIILDTPPLGLVTDAVLLMDYSTINVYVMRENYSRLNFIQAINGLVETRHLKHTGIVLNDSKIYSSTYRYGYSYGYGSGYGYGYGYGGYGGYGSYGGYGGYGTYGYGRGSYGYGYGFGLGYGYYDDDEASGTLLGKFTRWLKKKLNIEPKNKN